MKSILIVLLTFVTICSYSQNKTDISLKWKDTDEQKTEISSETGDLYKKLEHHGPAIENEWMGLRLYFDHKVAVDVYNKTRPGLELAEAGWYPTEEQQNEGLGADQYKVGSTVGMGGVRLWNPETKEEMFLDPVTKRTARVKKEAGISYMEVLSEGIPYMGDTIDVLVRVTVFSGHREAKVEAFALSSNPVYFLTGINYHDKTEVRQSDNFICTWGIHPEDVAAVQLNIGGAVLFNPDDFASITKEEKQFELVSEPTKYLSLWVTSACEKEEEINSLESFVRYIEGLGLTK
ncbi:uncharacterized protein DUF4861 [Marinilabilia salmonicolor]|jgi:hypothetical protein|uniref:DUF4861 family protein n=1 Tax=Marinilabilia salmonicolor TaxID=989 RepID=UPI000D0613B0|nr:DUF4861 family protein [Marinilabilia salmonicolor]PRY97805.1 uncharacterized protein DUF4861 [Marinilabilia salmonicolor]